MLPSRLDDPDYARLAWGRFRLILAWMTTFGVFCAGLALVALEESLGRLSIWTRLATLLGVAGSIVMAAALMGLAFLSSGTGHDEVVDAIDPDPGREDQRG